jgi:hypothetical protein
MSWDKNTFNTSKMAEVVKVLNELGEPYTCTHLGQVRAMGVNDSMNDIDVYSIKKLEYRDKVILERMERTHDCDSDDILTSHTFKKGEEPSEWPLEVYEDCGDYDCQCIKEGCQKQYYPYEGGIDYDED